MRQYTDAEKAKLKEIVNTGVQIMDDISNLKEGLSDTVKAISEELDLKPAALNRAIRSAYKADIEEKRNQVDLVEEILLAAGRKYD
jgi:DNA-binding MarR family transcriptional regulator